MHFHALDLDSAASHAALRAWLGQTFAGGISVLVNNAAMAYKGNTFGPQEAR